MAHGSASPIAPGRDLFAGQSGYATPKVDLRATAFRKTKSCWFEEREDGGWTLPGGWADVGESPTDGTMREVREESGRETRLVRRRQPAALTTSRVTAAQIHRFLRALPESALAH